MAAEAGAPPGPESTPEGGQPELGGELGGQPVVERLVRFERHLAIIWGQRPP